MKQNVLLAVTCAAMLASACASLPVAGSATAPAARIPATSIDLGDWRHSGANAAMQHFEREMAARYVVGAPLAAIGADLRRNDFACAPNRDGAGRGDPPDQICRKAVAVESCTHTWQVLLFDAEGNGVLARMRTLYDRHCGGDGLLGGPG